MSFNRDIDDLCVDNFEGSNDEQRIVKMAFLGNEIVEKSKRCLLTDTPNLEGESMKNTDKTLSSNIEDSAGTIKLNVNSFEVKDQVVKATSMNFAADRHSSKAPETQNLLISSAIPKATDYGFSCPDMDCDSQRVMFHLVESTSKGVTSSCYRFNKNGEMIKEDDTVDLYVLKCQFPDINGKEVHLGKLAASPISEESSISRSLVAIQCENIAEKSGSPLHANGGPNDRISLGLSSKLNYKRDPRPLLQKHIVRLLTEAGWCIKRHKRPSRSYMESVYRSPEGRSIRDFPKAWKLCGQILFAKRNVMVPENYGKEWADFSKFWSDLSDTLHRIEKEMNQAEMCTALAHQWCLLDPFVTVVFIKRKIGALRKGDAVKLSFIDLNATVTTGNCENIHRDLPGSSKQISDDNGKTLREMVEDGSKDSWKEINELFGCKDIPNCLTDGLIHSHDLDKTNAQVDSLVQIHSEFKPSIEVVKDRKCGAEVSRKFMEASKSFQVDTISKEKIHSKSKKLLEIGSTSLFGNDNAQIESSPVSCKHHLEKKRRCNLVGAKSVQKIFPVRDEDLLVSAILKAKDFNPKIVSSSVKSKSNRLRSWNKLKNQKGGRRLLLRCKEEEHLVHGNWCHEGTRTVLTWLVHAAVISLNDVVQHRNPADNSVVKDGLVSRDGIICRCCNTLFSVSAFKAHAGFKLNYPCLNLFMESGKSFTLCQLEAWSAEYKMRRNGIKTVQVDEQDKNDDMCGLCGDLGELICCDNCPSTFHQGCLSAQDLPEGSWYCTNCTCWICGYVVFNKHDACSLDALQCSLCENKYHEACLREKITYKHSVSGTWFCGGTCQEVYFGLCSRIGLINQTSGGFSWTLLRCIDDEWKIHSSRWYALKAECNSKLAVALTIMEECFQAMVDPKTGIDMVPHVLYNWGSNFARLNFHGFYTMVLEKDDVLISVASIRVHGVKVAEMPLIATCSKYRRHGMCRYLVNAIEEMLTSLKVEKLVIASIPELVDTWTNGFGFKFVEDEEKLNLNKMNLMMLPGTILVEKQLCESNKLDGQSGSDDTRPFGTEGSRQIGTGCKGEDTRESVQQGNEKSSDNEVVKCGLETNDDIDLQEFDFHAEANKGPSKVMAQSKEVQNFEFIQENENHCANEVSYQKKEEKIDGGDEVGAIKNEVGNITPV